MFFRRNRTAKIDDTKYPNIDQAVDIIIREIYIKCGKNFLDKLSITNNNNKNITFEDQLLQYYRYQYPVGPIWKIKQIASTNIDFYKDDMTIYVFGNCFTPEDPKQKTALASMFLLWFLGF